MSIDPAEILKVIIDAPHIFGKMLGYTKLLPVHDEFIKYIWDTSKSRVLQAHRGSYKTTAIIEVGCIRNIILCPDERVLIVRKEFKDNVKPVMTNIANNLMNPQVNEIVNAMYGVDLELVICNDSEIKTNLKKSITREASITGTSIGKANTGQHYDRVLTDDIVTVKDRTSEAERESVKLICQELRNIADPGCPVSHIGTPWHKNDAFSMLPKPRTYPISTTTIKEFTPEYINELKESMTASMFAANYDLKHIANEDAIFGTIKYFNSEMPGKRYAQLDARYSGKDKTAFTIGSKHDDKIYLVGWAFDKHTDDCLDFIIEKMEEYDVGILFLESNADKGYLARDIQMRFPVVKSYHEKMNKNVKIERFLKGNWLNVYFGQESNDLYIELIADYNDFSKFDDAPDSAASLIRERFDPKKAARITRW